MVLGAVLVFVVPLLIRFSIYAIEGSPRSWHDADWSSIGSLPPAPRHPDARLIVYASRTGGWKGAVSVHSWIVYKPAQARSWTRLDVVGWGEPLRTNGWAPDARWYGNPPMIVADIRGAAAEALLPKVEAAVARYPYRRRGDYRIWPGPNSNTFVAAVLRAVPELAATLPANAIGRDYRARPYLGATDSGTGLEANLWGVLSLKLGWIEGVELNLLGFVAGFDLRRPAVKLPGYGTVAVSGPRTAALATP